MCRCHKVNIKRPSVLLLKENLRKTLHRNLLSDLRIGNIAVLAEYTAKRTSRKEHSPRTAYARYAWLLPVMECRTRHIYITVTATSAAHAVKPVNTALSRT